MCSLVVRKDWSTWNHAVSIFSADSRHSANFSMILLTTSIMAKIAIAEKAALSAVPTPGISAMKPRRCRGILTPSSSLTRARDPLASDIENFVFGPYNLNLQTRTLTHDGQSKSLTTGEFAVMKAFARHPRQPLSREKLMELARGREYEVFDRSLDVQISRLRKLIEADPSSPRYIQTVWGLGYVFIPDGPPAATPVEPALQPGTQPAPQPATDPQ